MIEKIVIAGGKVSTMWVVYVIGINLVTLYLMAHDKSQARTKGRRVRERTFFLLATLGGAIGAIAGMRIWRHKTKHSSFVIGMPVLLILNLVVGYGILFR
jgi:uncharacterized membrane protein YsdA (DUF1294 family)